MAVQVDFGQWGVQALAPGQDAWWWYTWIFDAAHWSRFTALPQSWSPAAGAIQIVEEWTTNGTHHVHWRNNGTDYVYFAPTVIVAPGRYGLVPEAEPVRRGEHGVSVDVVYAPDGTVIGLGYLVTDTHEHTKTSGPTAGPGQLVGRLTLPEGAEPDQNDIAALRVDTAGHRHTLVRR